MKMTEIHLNDGNYELPKNPRLIKDARFDKLCDSIRDNPEFMPARPIIVDESGTILGGNMRYRACQHLGMTDIPDDWVQRVTGWSVEKKRRFIILDNRTFGTDDEDLLVSDWNIDELLAAGFDNAELFGTEDDDDKNKKIAEEKIEDLRPIKRLHILLSMTSDQAMDLFPKIEKLAKEAGAEVHSAGN